MAGCLQLSSAFEMSTSLSDEEVVQRVKAGDRESYGVLAARHHERLNRLAQRFVHDPADAEDAVQGAHLLALKHFDQYEGRSAYVHWMGSITVNEVRTHYRRDRVSVASEVLKDCHAADEPSPEQLAIGQDIQRAVGRALDKIPAAYGLVFRMREMAELSIAETGRRLGLTDTCVKTRLHRARWMLRRALERELGSAGLRRPQRRKISCSGGLQEQTHTFA